MTLHSSIARLQHRAASALGVDENRRTETVVAMLENNRRRAPGYWIQLFLAMGIATLGLVLNSTAVVIGAMLVSPLMGPILELGMGFAVGSSFLVIRASIRVALSVVLTIAGAAIVTLALPFHEITGEIAARAAPTALDLLVAVFCALTAAYTTVRPASDTTSAAAGTAIGIALVPPLCACGFGIGTASMNVAGGAGLLFTANLSAILVLAVVSFLILGYNQVNAQQLEDGLLEPDSTRTGRLASRGQSRLRLAFGSKYGLAFRLIIPVIFLAAVYVPLRRALNEVTWEVRARAAIRSIVSANAPRAVQTAIVVERHTVTLRLVVLGSSERAATLERVIQDRITAQTGAVPNVTVTAVPDAKTLAAASANREAAVAPPDLFQLVSVRQRASEAIMASWPLSAAGPLLGWAVVVPSRESPSIVVRHLGAPLGSAGEVLLAQSMSARIGGTVRIIDAPLATSSASAAIGREREWLAKAIPILDWVGQTDGAAACVRAPMSPSRRANNASKAALASVRASTAATAGRVTVQDSAGWGVHVVGGACPPPDSTRGR